MNTRQTFFPGAGDSNKLLPAHETPSLKKNTTFSVLV